MKHIQLIGMGDKEREKALLDSHRDVLRHLEMHKEGKIEWKHFDLIQNYLMDAAGYMNKEANYGEKEVVVSFGGNIFPSNPLVGKGENELEAICDACKNLVKNPGEYNTFSIKYLEQLKKEFPELVK